MARHDAGGHGHHDGHGHGRSDGAPSLDRAFAIGIAINVAFVVVEAFYGWRADSLALLADAGHNLGDVLGLGLAWAGAFAGRLAPDERHTYGYHHGQPVREVDADAFIDRLDALAQAGLDWPSSASLS